MCVYICDCVSMCGCMCEHVGVCARACFSVRVHVWRWLDYREIWNGDGIQAEADHIVAVIASFEAPDFITFQASRSRIFLIRGSISRNYNSIGHRHCKNLVQVSIFLAREFAIKNS